MLKENKQGEIKSLHTTVDLLPQYIPFPLHTPLIDSPHFYQFALDEVISIINKKIEKIKSIN